MVRVQPSPPLAFRGTLVSFAGDPFLVGPDEAVRHESDGLIVCRDGLIEAVGPYNDLRRELAADVPIADYSGCIISAGFIDAHIHYVQTGIIAAPPESACSIGSTTMSIQPRRHSPTRSTPAPSPRSSATRC
jgi:guanine deaminase